MLGWMFFKLRFHVTTMLYSFFFGIAAHAGLQEAIANPGPRNQGYRFLYLLPAIVAVILAAISNWNTQISNTTAILFIGEGAGRLPGFRARLFPRATHYLAKPRGGAEPKDIRHINRSD
jgi:hypothetical protein